MKKAASILLSLFLLISTDFAQTGNLKLTGLITDASTGEALIGTNILIYKDSLNLSLPPFRGAVSNQFGFYVITGIPVSDYYLIARYIGYKTVIREIKVKESETAFRLNIEMQPENLELEEVIVKGEKKKMPDVSTIDISPEILEKLPSLSGEVDVLRSLQMLPGVTTASEISNGLYIRGGSPDQTLTLVDGIIIYNPGHLANFASTFNSDALKDVKLIKGAFPAEYGGRLSSVLDIKLRSGTKERNKGIISLGAVNSHATFEGPMGENATYMISGRKMYYDFFQKSFDENSTIPRYNFYDLSAKVTRTLSDESILFISGMYNQDNIYNPPSKTTGYSINWRNIALGLNWIQINSNSVFSNSLISYVDYNFRSSINDNLTPGTLTNYFSSSDLKDLDVHQKMELHWNQDNTAKMGFDLAMHFYDLLYSDVYEPSVETDPFSGYSLTSLESSFYFQNESHFTDNLYANIGGRIYYFNQLKYLRFEPRISVNYTPIANFRLKAAYAIAHQFLHLIVRNDIALPTDLWYPSTKNIKPGKSAQYVFGFDFTIPDYVFSIEGYYKSMKSLYEFKNSPRLNPRDKNIDEQFTEGEGEAYGVELFANRTAGNFTGWLGYTLSWTRSQYDELNAGRVFYPRYDRRHDISMVITYEPDRNWTLGATWVYASGQGFTIPTGQFIFTGIGIEQTTDINFNYTDRNAYKLPAYHKLDLSASYKFSWAEVQWEAYLNIYNVYNRNNAFAQYVTFEKNNNGEDVPKLKQISLFPVIPMAGIKLEF
ncbi:MAG TPA: TonB-dependent receptor [Ignavibacteriaceae bacterium]|nr:TonB-dependent receptor [Ignavibacteriaceae bacterium]